MRPGVLLLVAVLWTQGAILAQVGMREHGRLPIRPDAAAKSADFASLPLFFAENRGAYSDEVRYYVKGARKSVLFTDDGVAFVFRGATRDWTVKLDFVGACAAARPRGVGRQGGVISHFRGPEKEWRTGVPTFARVVYRDLWPGIDLVYRGARAKLKYAFTVAPGADPSRIRLRYRGATSVTLQGDGALKVRTPEGSFEDESPTAWQEVNGRRVPVDMAYRLGPPDTRGGVPFGFSLGSYDPALPLVLDPAVFVYCGFIGGLDFDSAVAVALDAAGNLYVIGITSSDPPRFPVKIGPGLVRKFGKWDWDAFVAKVNAKGTGLVYCGYISGASPEWGLGIDVDQSGCACVTGFTKSDEKSFPVKGGPDLTHNGGEDAFVAKVNAKGTGLLYCGYLGGAGDDRAQSVAVDAAGRVHVAGMTASTEKTFPVTVGPGLKYRGATDAFVAKVNANGVGLAYCGYVGGSSRDAAYGIDLDATGHAYLTGVVRSGTAFPAVGGPDLTHNGGDDAFVAKVSPKGTGLVYCGFLGGSGKDHGAGIAVDAAGAAYVTGLAASDQRTFPVKVGPSRTLNGSDDVFVAKVNAKGTGLDYCGYIGGNQYEEAGAIAVDWAGHAYVTGSTPNYTQAPTKGFPLKVGPIVKPLGEMDAFVAKVNAAGSALVYCGLIGAHRLDAGLGIAVDGSGNAYVSGDSEWFRGIVGPDVNHNGSYDAFVAKVALTLLTVGGDMRPGGVVALLLEASDDVGRTYQVGTSLGTGPIAIDTRHLGLSLDALLVASVSGTMPTVFCDYRGLIGQRGVAAATIHIPRHAALIGVKLHSAFVTGNAASPSRIGSISNTGSFTIAR